MGKTIIHFASDFALWAVLVVAVAILSSAGLIENQALALAGGALWLAIRAYRKAEVSAAHNKKSQEV